MAYYNVEECRALKPYLEENEGGHHCDLHLLAHFRNSLCFHLRRPARQRRSCKIDKKHANASASVRRRKGTVKNLKMTERLETKQYFPPSPKKGNKKKVKILPESAILSESASLSESAIMARVLTGVVTMTACLPLYHLAEDLHRTHTHDVEVGMELHGSTIGHFPDALHIENGLLLTRTRTDP